MDNPSGICLAGLSNVDWYLAVPEDLRIANVDVRYAFGAVRAPKLSSHAGGAALLHEVVDRSLTELGRPGAVVVAGPVIPDDLMIDPNSTHIARSFSTWRPVPRETGSRETVWRMQRFLGFDVATETSQVSMPQWPTDANRNTLFIEDAPGHSSQENIAHIANLLSGTSPRHVVIRQTGGLGNGPVWEQLVRDHADAMIGYCAIGDLRRSGAPVGRPLSWERAAQDINAAVRGNAGLSQAKFVVVTLSASGAVLVDRDGPSVLIFDPFHQEDDWEMSRPGIAFGSGTCVVASLILATATGAEEPDAAAIALGLSAARDLHQGGFQAEPSGHGWRLAFPTERIARVLVNGRSGDSPFETAVIETDPTWRLFETTFHGSFREAAERIARDGEGAAGGGIPTERMGAWSSVDRIEIESMRSLRNIIAEYLSQPQHKRPLNLAVFGPPGSGKSFAIKQMARQLGSGGQRLDILEFNLSQFQSPEELGRALQEVRDRTVRGTLPLVFWDEFDTRLNGQEMGWLVRFLAPMQDGAFMEDGNERPIGPAIFVFAGGTHATMESFRDRAFEIPGAKATDFISRLRGFVNILGPNPADNTDQTYFLRRAMLLRALLKARAPQIFSGDRLEIDAGILRAFLDIARYEHGSRSMESIVDMSAMSGALGYERGALPAVHQMSLHVDGEQFNALVEQGER